MDEAELDAAEFARLTREGRHALATGKPADAIAWLGAALGLWNGTAGAGLPPGTSLAPRLLALDEQRQAVYTDYVQARLDTGACQDAVADLRRHLVTWPAQERCWELLMLALYRSGDAAGALDAYTKARTYLQEQLGIDPGQQLRRMQRAVLVRDPSLDAPVTQTVTLAPARRAETSALPPVPAALVGRDGELAELTAALRAERPLGPVSKSAAGGE